MKREITIDFGGNEIGLQRSDFNRDWKLEIDVLSESLASKYRR